MALNLKAKSGKRTSLICLVFFIGIIYCHSQVTYQDAFPNLSFEYPTEIMNANDGTNRLFVLEQAGRIKVFLISDKTDIFMFTTHDRAVSLVST